MESILSEIVAGLPKRTQYAFPPPEPQQPKGGYHIRVAQPYVSPLAKARVMKAIDDNTISSGSSVVEEFESELKDFFKVPLAVACSNGYSALFIALKLAGIGEDDDVLIPSFTFIAVVNAVIAIGANPVFVDSESTQQINPSVAQYKDKLTPTTKALIVTHTYGTPGNSAHIRTFCDEHDLIMIEDIAEAIGVEINGKLAGTYGDYACSSLYANKVITAGDGGFILSKHSANMVETRAKSYRNHGFSMLYRFVHFEPSGNYKMSGLQAAFVLPAVKEIPKVIEDRLRISNQYRMYLEPATQARKLSVISRNRYGTDSPWVFGVMLKSKETRKAVRQSMATKGIETREYFFPLHMQPSVTKCFKVVESLSGTLPVSEDLAMRGLCLPTYYGLREEDIQYICNCLLTCL